MPAHTAYFGEQNAYRIGWWDHHWMAPIVTESGKTYTPHGSDTTGIAYYTSSGATFQLPAAEYPVSVQFSGYTGSGWAYDGDDVGEITLSLYICNGTVTNNHVNVNTSKKLTDIVLTKGRASKTTAAFAISNGQALAGQALQIWGVATSRGIWLNGQVTVTITTASITHSITITQATGGTAEASAATAAAGETITLTATPNTGYRLSRWNVTEGGITVSNNRFTMPDADVAITPVWETVSYTITTAVSPSGAGTVTANSSAAYGSQVTVSQTPKTGYRFTGWTLSSGGTVSNNKFTMPAANVTVTAVYEAITYTITTAVSPSGAGTVTANSSAAYGSQVTVSQTAATGYTFSGWTLSSGGSVSNNKFTMPAQNVTLTANYTVKSYTITKAVSPNGAGTITKPTAQKANYGSTVQVAQTTATGYTFSGWTLSSGGTVSGGQFTMPAANVTLTAVYTSKTFTITTKVSPAGAGTITAPASAAYGSQVSISQTAAAGYTFSGWQLSSGGSVTNGKFTMPAKTVTVTAVYTANSYGITKSISPSGGGTVTAPATAAYRDKVSISQTPSTGYRFSSWALSNGGTIANNQFTMPAQAVTLSVTYSKISYTISKSVSPAGAGTITAPATATYGETVSLSQTPATGYYFSGWQLSSGGGVSNNNFTMPAANVTVTAKYLKRSTATLSSKTIKGGGRLDIVIDTESREYSHKYNVTFTNGVTTGDVNVAAGTLTVSMTVPESWATYETGASYFTGGTFTLKTYKGSTLIGTYTITGLRYNMPDSAKPTVAGTPTRLTTADGITFADVGEYVQNHSGIKMVATGTPKHGASLASIRIRIEGYDGKKYDKTFTSFSSNKCTFNSGILTRSGTTKVIMTVTDSRGLSGESTYSFSVKAYEAPSITSFQVWRANSSGDADDNGTYGKFSAGYRWTAVGSNAVTRKITAKGTTATVTVDTGWLLPSSRKTFPVLQSAKITYTVSDLFETTSVTVSLDSTKFIIHFNAAGNSVAFGHAVQETPTSGSGYTGTFEIDDSMEIHIGVPGSTPTIMTLKEYILAVVNGQI